jgi:hypothetical protein
MDFAIRSYGRLDQVVADVTAKAEAILAPEGSSRGAAMVAATRTALESCTAGAPDNSNVSLSVDGSADDLRTMLYISISIDLPAQPPELVKPSSV